MATIFTTVEWEDLQTIWTDYWNEFAVAVSEAGGLGDSPPALTGLQNTLQNRVYPKIDGMLRRINPLAFSPENLPEPEYLVLLDVLDQCEKLHQMIGSATTYEPHQVIRCFTLGARLIQQAIALVEEDKAK